MGLISNLGNKAQIAVLGMILSWRFDIINPVGQVRARLRDSNLRLNKPELALAGAGFLRAIWIDEIVINGIEIRPLGVDSFEFDDEGTMEISFLAIKSGTFTFGVPGIEDQTLEITIE